MFKFIFTSLLMLQLSSSFAFAADSSSKREILRLTREVESVLLDSDADSATLADVKSHLEDAIELLKRGNSGPGPDNECVTYAYENYFRALSSAPAMDKASEACRGNQSLVVLKLLFDKFFRSLSVVPSMDKAAELAKQDVEDKEDIIEFAYDKYFRSLSSAPSIEKAASSAITVSSRSLSCLQARYEVYFKSMSSAPAMDAAFNACR